MYRILRQQDLCTQCTGLKGELVANLSAVKKAQQASRVTFYTE